MQHWVFPAKWIFSAFSSISWICSLSGENGRNGRQGWLCHCGKEWKEGEFDDGRFCCSWWMVIVKVFRLVMIIKRQSKQIYQTKTKTNANTRCLMTNKNTRLRRWRRSQGAWKRPWGWFKDVQSLSDPSLAPGSSYVSIYICNWIKFIICLWCFNTNLPWNLELDLDISVAETFQFKFSFFNLHMFLPPAPGGVLKNTGSINMSLMVCDIALLIQNFCLLIWLVPDAFTCDQVLKRFGFSLDSSQW